MGPDMDGPIGPDSPGPKGPDSPGFSEMVIPGLPIPTVGNAGLNINEPKAFFRSVSPAVPELCLLAESSVRPEWCKPELCSEGSPDASPVFAASTSMTAEVAAAVGVVGTKVSNWLNRGV
jgi:hypothetical protein